MLASAIVPSSGVIMHTNRVVYTDPEVADLVNEGAENTESEVSLPQITRNSQL